MMMMMMRMMMMSGSASAHLPTIIWLSSVAVFSAPLTDTPTGRRGRTSGTLSNRLWIFSIEIKTYLNFYLIFFIVSFPGKEITHFEPPAESKSFSFVGVFLKQDWPCGSWMCDFIHFHSRFWFGFSNYELGIFCYYTLEVQKHVECPLSCCWKKFIWIFHRRLQR